MELVFIHGPAGSGKLTVARELSRMTGLRLFHNHLTVDAVTAVFDFGSEPFVRTAGRGTTGQARFWKRHLAELLQGAPRPAK
jgi:cytidylate kinase